MCDFKTEASRKYVVAQNIIKHKEDVHKSLKKSHKKIIKCNECDFVARDSMVMKRHIRDEHGTGSISISPPPKNNAKLQWKISMGKKWKLLRIVLKT